MSQVRLFLVFFSYNRPRMKSGKFGILSISAFTAAFHLEWPLLQQPLTLRTSVGTSNKRSKSRKGLRGSPFERALLIIGPDIRIQLL